MVSAGGQGLYTILDGALHYVRGEVEAMQFRSPTVASSIPLTAKNVTAPKQWAWMKSLTAIAPNS